MGSESSILLAGGHPTVRADDFGCHFAWNALSHRNMAGINNPSWKLPQIAVCVVLLLLAAALFGSVRLEIAETGITWLLLLGSFSSTCYLLYAMRHLTVIEPDLINLPLELARDGPTYAKFLDYARELNRIRNIPDPIFRTNVNQRLSEIDSELTELGNGTLVFQNTESWRIAYEQLLRSKVVYLYRSVAWMRYGGYWHDEPGQKSLQLIYELVDSQQLSMERIVILSELLWPTNEQTPTAYIVDWIHDQRHHRIPTRLIRESSLENDQDLLIDFGIYGSHAMGRQYFDENSRTRRFELRFNFNSVAESERHWDRLFSYSVSLEQILQHPP